MTSLIHRFVGLSAYFQNRWSELCANCKCSSYLEKYDKVQYVYLDFSLRTRYCTKYKSKIPSGTTTQIAGNQLRVYRPKTRSNITFTSQLLLYMTLCDSFSWPGEGWPGWVDYDSWLILWMNLRKKNWLIIY